MIGATGTTYQLEAKPLSSGGEGEIYRVLGGTQRQVAKIYKAGVATRELEEKLKRMVNRKPSSKVISQVAWPLDIIYDSNKRFCGFIMPELHINSGLSEIYKYPTKLNISALHKIIIAENICAVISEVHRAGYIFGDFNPQNIGVDKNTGTVAFLDTDSYHVIDTSLGKAYRCNVCASGYSAPELLERCAAHVAANPKDKDHAYAKTPLPTFTKETDNFALAVHIFKLLMNGYTPYGGIKDTDSASQASPGTGDAAVRRDNYCFKPGMKSQSPAILPLEALPQEIADLFTRAFIIGKRDPKQRPTAIEWHGALERYEKVLRTCAKNPLHQYDKKNYTCPLCEADERYINSTAPQISQKSYVNTVQTPVISPPVPRPQGANIPASPAISNVAANYAPAVGMNPGSKIRSSGDELSDGGRIFLVWMVLLSGFLFLPFVFEGVYYTVMNMGLGLLVACLGTLLVYHFVFSKTVGDWEDALGLWFCVCAVLAFHHCSIWLVHISGGLGFLTWLGCGVLGILMIVYVVMQSCCEGVKVVVNVISYILSWFFCLGSPKYLSIIPAYVVWVVGAPVALLILFAVIKSVKTATA